MKKLLLIPLLYLGLQSIVSADTKTSGRVVLTLPTTGYVDVSKRIDVKFNENFLWISTALNAIDTSVSTNTTALTNRLNALDVSTTSITTSLNANWSSTLATYTYLTTLQSVIATDTTTLKTSLDENWTSTLATYTYLTTLQTTIASDTTTIKTRIDNLDTSTASLTTRIEGHDLFRSSASVAIDYSSHTAEDYKLFYPTASIMITYSSESANSYRLFEPTSSSKMVDMYVFKSTAEGKIDSWLLSQSTIASKFSGFDLFKSSFETTSASISSLTVYGTITSTSGFIVGNSTASEILINGIRVSTHLVTSGATSPDNDRWVNSNYLMNAEFLINQRTSTGGVWADGVYGYDRWETHGVTEYYLSASTMRIVSGGLKQVIESPNLSNRTVTFSVEDATATLTVHVEGGGNNQTISAGNGRQGVTFVISSTATGNISVIVSGTNVSFKRPQLELGSSYSQFQPTTYAQELARCQRYYEKWTAPEGNERYSSACVGQDADTGLVVVTFAEKRAKPTVTTSAANTFIVEAIGIPSAITASASSFQTNRTFTFNAPSTGNWGAKASSLFRAGSTSAYLIFDSEL